MAERDLRPCLFDCKYAELAIRVCRDITTKSEIGEMTIAEVQEECDRRRLEVAHEYGIDIACGFAGEAVVKQALEGEI